MTQEDKLIRILLHSSAFHFAYLVPIVIYFISEDSQVKRLSIQAILFQMLFHFLLGVTWFFSWFLIGFPFFLFFGAIYLVTPFVGMWSAFNGWDFEYPIIGCFFR